MEGFSEEQSKALFLALLIALIEEEFGIVILSKEEEEKLLEKMDVSKGLSESEALELTLNSINLMLDQLGIRNVEAV